MSRLSLVSTEATFAGRTGTERKAGVFEVIVGKSIPDIQARPKRFGFVNDYDTKPKRRLFDVLTAQGMQMNQTVIFMSDGGESVRNVQEYLTPNAEYMLDWFHVAMRLTVLKTRSTGLTNVLPACATSYVRSWVFLPESISKLAGLTVTATGPSAMSITPKRPWFPGRANGRVRSCGREPVVDGTVADRVWWAAVMALWSLSRLRRDHP